MQSGQFYRGKIDGIQKHYESPNLSEILPYDKLQELADNTVLGEYPRFFKNEKVLAKTVVSPAENSDGRKGGVTNHTVLYRFDQTVTHDGLQYVFPLEDFIAEILAGKRRFKMPPAPDLPFEQGFISFPPPLEWEVET
jgi:hypothetical protein